jgi:hypothetical protein
MKSFSYSFGILGLLAYTSLYVANGYDVPNMVAYVNIATDAAKVLLS